MLVLSRKPGESIRIGNNITITVTELRGGRVKIGIDAPGQLAIRRAELPDWRDATHSADAPAASTQNAASAKQFSGKHHGSGKHHANRPARKPTPLSVSIDLRANSFVTH